MNLASKESLSRDDTRIGIWIIVTLVVFLLSSFLVGAACLL